MKDRFSETQAIRNRRQTEAAERQARYMGWILAIEIIGFTTVIILELLR